MMRRSGSSRFQVTVDAAFDGRLLLRQPRSGYRFSADAPLLVWFSCRGAARPARRAADLGAGCGVVGLGLLLAGAAERVVAVEAQERLAALCAENAEANGLGDRLEVVNGDMRESHPALTRRRFDLVVANPPFWPADTGHLPADGERRIACHEVRIDLDGWIGVAAELLEPRRGRLCAVFPARRVSELLAGLTRGGLGAASLLAVHPSPDAEAELVLVEARPGCAARPTAVEPPLFLRDRDNRDSEAARAVYAGAFSAALAGRPDRRL
ncbi:MAG: methyltransferase [Proteobacteria bacterium]|nr:methyltransferase [Pseudomonadota bacterium]